LNYTCWSHDQQVFMFSTAMIQIDYLANHLDLAPTLATWHFEEWGRGGGFRPGDSCEERLRFLRAAANRGTLPTVFVAVDGDRLAGSATLAASDMDTRMDLTPWLIDVFVTPELRRRGIASMLCRRVVREAADLGVATMYLFTTGPEREHLYAGLGWQVIDRPLYKGAVRVLMSINPQAQPSYESRARGSSIDRHRPLKS
jgi:GNAT superfamily N-acetyltransferase